ncbi:Histone methyltransferase [Phytophthora megakarya]|uniref:Histone methyltransferase n=1 Tax=Phytophthora megakarya TaxID=4795 RepID=A0A225WGC7_9STRA|nr:Histone methyltransferase [Phytophthora megakarya]
MMQNRVQEGQKTLNRLKERDIPILQGKQIEIFRVFKICERHGHEKCMRAGNYCTAYIQPPLEEEIDVSWPAKTSVYLYESIDYKIQEMNRTLAKHGY